MTEHLFEVAFEACVEGHHSVGIHLHVGNIASTGMFPSRLPRENQVHMIPAQDRCEYQEEEEEDDEDHEYCLDVVPLAPLDVDWLVREINDSLGVCSEGKVQGRNLWHSLEKKE